MKILIILKLSLCLVIMYNFNVSFAIEVSDDPLQNKILADEEELFDIAQLAHEERAGPFPTFDECNNCTRLNEAGKRSSLLVCCDAFRKCCDGPSAVKCPNMGMKFNAGGNYCNLSGPFCRDDSNCGYGSKCCDNTDSASPIKKYKCCWTPNN